MLTWMVQQPEPAHEAGVIVFHLNCQKNRRHKNSSVIMSWLMANFRAGVR